MVEVYECIGIAANLHKLAVLVMFCRPLIDSGAPSGSFCPKSKLDRIFVTITVLKDPGYIYRSWKHE